MARVLAVDFNGETVAYPFDVLQEERVVNDAIGGVAVVVIWEPGTASALDTAIIANGQDVGTANVYRRELDGGMLTFSFDGQNVIDDQTQSVWNTLGQAVAGELAGQQLEAVVSVNHFWFSWSVFMPETRVYSPQ
jgi:hypothetical protein